MNVQKQENYKTRKIICSVDNSYKHLPHCVPQYGSYPYKSISITFYFVTETICVLSKMSGISICYKTCLNPMILLIISNRAQLASKTIKQMHESKELSIIT